MSPEARMRAPCYLVTTEIDEADIIGRTTTIVLAVKRSAKAAKVWRAGHVRRGGGPKARVYLWPTGADRIAPGDRVSSLTLRDMGL